MAQHEVKSLFRRTNDVNSEIEYIGGINSDGSSWKITIDKAIEGIEKGKWEFFVLKNNVKINVVMRKDNRKLVLDLEEVNFLDLNDINL